MKEELKAWGPDVALRGPEAPKNDGMLKHLIEYLLTVYERFGNTSVTESISLQWGATALWKRDEQKKRIEELEAMVHVQGMLRCKKCGFELFKRTLYVQSGTVGADNTPEGCPNDGSPMWKVSEREYREEILKSLYSTRNETLEVAASICEQLVEGEEARARLQARSILTRAAKAIRERKTDG